MPHALREGVDMCKHSIPQHVDIRNCAGKRDYTYDMTKQMFVQVATVIFGIVGLVHLYRAFSDMPLLIGTSVIPVAVSWVAGVAALFLAYSGYRHWK